MRRFIPLLITALLLLTFGCVQSSGKSGGLKNTRGSPSSALNLNQSKISEVKSVLEGLFSIQTGKQINLTFSGATSAGEVYLLNFSSSAGVPVVVGISKDYKKLFLYVLDFNKLKKRIEMMKSLLAQLQKAKQSSNKKVVKSNKPNVELFVMSYCPYGLQMEKAMIPVMELLHDYANFSVKFVYYSMHPSVGEVEENLRQYCIQKVQPDKYLDYLKCFVQTGSYSNPVAYRLCLQRAAIDVGALEKCMKETDAKYKVTYYLNNKSTWLSGRFPLFEVNAAENKKYGVQGSPTLVINGHVVEVQRSPEAIKELICQAFVNPPAVCNTTLLSTVPAPGFGPLTASSSSSGAGTCG